MNSIESLRSNESLVQYVYTLGVMVSGVVFGEQFGGFDSALLWASLFVVALGWVGYYQFVVVPRLERFGGGEQETPDDRS